MHDEGFELTWADNCHVEGLRYAEDYGESFTSRSIVDKSYVDGQMVSFTMYSESKPLNVWLCKNPNSYEELFNDISFDDYAKTFNTY